MSKVKAASEGAAVVKLDTKQAVLEWAGKTLGNVYTPREADDVAVAKHIAESERLRQAFEYICKIGPNARDDLFIRHMRAAIEGPEAAKATP